MRRGHVTAIISEVYSTEGPLRYSASRHTNLVAWLTLIQCRLFPARPGNLLYRRRLHFSSNVTFLWCYNRVSFVTFSCLASCCCCACHSWLVTRSLPLWAFLWISVARFVSSIPYMLPSCFTASFSVSFGLVSLISHSSARVSVIMRVYFCHFLSPWLSLSLSLSPLPYSWAIPISCRQIKSWVTPHHCALCPYPVSHSLLQPDKSSRT